MEELHHRMKRQEAIEMIFDRHGPDALYVTCTGYISRSAYKIKPEWHILYIQGSMGLSPAIGLGIALNTDKEVVVFTGDGALLMHLGTTHTIRDSQVDNLHIYVLDNGCYESVGGQKCSPLEEYPCVKIIKIEQSEADPRIPLDWFEIRNKIEEWI